MAVDTYVRTHARNHKLLAMIAVDTRVRAYIATNDWLRWQGVMHTKTAMAMAAQKWSRYHNMWRITLQEGWARTIYFYVYTVYIRYF
jgi:hypothetical protein